MDNRRRDPAENEKIYKAVRVLGLPENEDTLAILGLCIITWSVLWFIISSLILAFIFMSGYNSFAIVAGKALLPYWQSALFVLFVRVCNQLNKLLSVF